MGRTELPKPTYAHNRCLIGHSDQAGRSDGQQIMAHNGHAYIGHVCLGGSNRPVVLHSADVFVDRNGICHSTDWSVAGLYIMEYAG